MSPESAQMRIIKEKVWKVLSAIFRISLLQNSAAVLLLRMLLMQKTGPTVFH